MPRVLGHSAGLHVVLHINKKGLKLTSGKPSNPQKQVSPRLRMNSGRLEHQSRLHAGHHPKALFSQIYELV